MRSLWLLLFASFCTNVIQAAPIGFLVAQPPQGRIHHDSYVIAIDSADAARLNHARALLGWVRSGADPNESPGATIVVADIRPGGDGINRNALAPGQPIWNWRVEGQVEFTDFTIEILDGTPTMVEDDVIAWIANTGGAVGFWSYTVVAELGVVPEPSSWGFIAISAIMTARRRSRIR